MDIIQKFASWQMFDKNICLFEENPYIRFNF